MSAAGFELEAFSGREPERQRRREPAADILTLNAELSEGGRGRTQAW